MHKSTKRKDQRRPQLCKAGNNLSHYRTLKRCHINPSSNNLPRLRRATIDRMEVAGVEMKVQEGDRATTAASTTPRRSNSSRTCTTRPSSERIYISPQFPSLIHLMSHETIVNIVRERSMHDAYKRPDTLPTNDYCR